MLQSLAPADRRPALPFAGGEPRPRRFPIIGGEFMEIAGRRGRSGLLPAAFSSLGRGMILAPDFRKVNRRRRVGEVEIRHRVGDDLRYREIAEPFVRSTGSRTTAPPACWSRESRPQTPRCSRPRAALGIVGLADLPVARGVVEALGETRELLFLADMEEEFEDRGSVLDQQGLEVANLLVAPVQVALSMSLWTRVTSTSS